MIVQPTPLHKAVLLVKEPIRDDRGYFSRSFCKKTLAEHGISFDMVQSNEAFNHSARTLRGMHFQLPPFSEEKIVTCYHGEIYDVIIDLNVASPTYGKWFGVNLSSENGLSLYVPKGFAHGYVTLTDQAGIHYMVSEYYSPSYESGVRWDDPAFGVEWPFSDHLIISKKDSNWKEFCLETDGIVL